MSIEQGKLGRLKDVDVTTTAPAEGDALVYDETTGKWIPGSIKTDGSSTVIGTPTDGEWNDGIAGWTPETKVSDAFDDLNEILADLAPANALTLGSTSLAGGPTKYSGKLPSGLDAAWYSKGKNPGDTVTDLTKTTKGTITTPNTSTTFNYADQGLLQLIINGVVKATIDLGANFVEANRNGNQIISGYNVKGNGSTIAAGVVTFAEGTFAITSVGKYNNFKKWQKGNATVVLTSDLSEGVNTVVIKHVGLSADQTSNEYVMYFDNDATNPTISVAPTITENTATGKYLSGVKYYTTGDTFSVGYTVSNAYKKAYHSTQVSDYVMPGFSSVTKNPTGIPALADLLVVSDASVAISSANVMTNNARLTVNARDPYNNVASLQSPSEGRLILTYPNRSTDKAEYFTDEIYRLPLSFDFTSKTAPVKNVWDSSVALSNGNAQCYLNGSNPALVFPTGNFSTGFVPSNTANYSTFTGNQAYTRAFLSTGTPQSSVTLTLNGIAAGLGQVGAGDVNVEIKLPGLSGWGDALKPYDAGANKANDGWGMLSGSVSYAGGNATLTATFGGFSTVNSGDKIFVRVTLRNGTRAVTSMTVGW